MLDLQEGEERVTFGNLKLESWNNLSSGVSCVIPSPRSGQTLDIPITGKNNVLEAPNFSLETPSQTRNSCGQGLALEERVGWGGRVHFALIYFLEGSPKLSLDLELVPLALRLLQVLLVAQPSPGRGFPWPGLPPALPGACWATSPHWGPEAPGWGFRVGCSGGKGEAPACELTRGKLI